MKRITCFALFFLLLVNLQLPAQNKDSLFQEVKKTMLKATKFMVENVSINGGYVWYYLPDFSRRWGEMEAYKTMIWLQSPGTVSMGHLFLDAFEATDDPYYYHAAEKTANAIIWGQSHEGGWNYMIDFAGDRSLKEWYNTIGKNGWRLEEFQHYYGNSTFDDDITSDAARFLLRIYLEKLDPVYKPALDKAIDFILKSQYSTGGWPQRYPLRSDFSKAGHPDYTSFYTFNDDVTWENIHFLIQCYQTLGEERFLDPIRRGMNFYLISQDKCGGWAQQLTTSLKTAGARTYEPAALLPGTTFENAMLMLTYYQYSGEKKFLEAVPNAIQWLEKTALPPDKSQGGWVTHPTFVEPGTGKPLYVHRKGSNVKFGYYYVDYKDDKLLAHYHGKSRIPVEMLKKEYNRVAALAMEEATKDSPIKVGKFDGDKDPQHFFNLKKNDFPPGNSSSTQIREIIQSLDSENRWLIKHVMISHPYIGDGVKQDLTEEYASTNVGDETDTSPYRDLSEQEYISTGNYIRNMGLLINYIQSFREKSNN
jgi:hypothetical protein